MTAVAQVAFPHQANGSFIVTADGRTIGSSLIGQAFDQPEVLLEPAVGGRAPDGYDASASAGSNLGPTNQKLIDRVTARVDALRAANGDKPDPGRPRHDVGVRARSRHQPSRGRLPGGARRQGARRYPRPTSAPRSARHTEQPLLGFLGEPRVNVLLLNLDLDGLLAHE